MKRIKHFVALLLLALFVTMVSCATFDSSYNYQNNNIRVVTISALVDGMKMVDGYTRSAGNLTGSTESLARVFANEAAKNGYSNCTIFVKQIGQGPNSKQFEVTIWK